MPENAISKLMWENNPDTPITASNLSEAIDFQSRGKFIEFTSTQNDYVKWADYTLNTAWPSLESWDTQNLHLNKIIYNFFDNTVRRPIFDIGQNRKVWETLPSPYNKILKIKANTKISSSYTETTGKVKIASYNFIENQIVTIDDLLSTAQIKDFKANTRYFVYIYAKHSYNDEAHVKLLEEADEGQSFWKTDYATASSPTGNNIITYRKIGGFKTSAAKEIIAASIWDLSTYVQEIAASSIKVFENGEPRLIGAKDFQVVDTQNLFSSSTQTLTVEEALFQTRALINNLNRRFYTNRRVGFNLQFAHVYKSGTTYVAAPLNSLTLRLTPGFIDVLGTQVSIDNALYFSSPSMGIKINDGPLVYNPRIVTENTGLNNILYPGTWRVFVDFNGIFTFRHELAAHGLARWIPSYHGWFDTTGKRCVGKFKIRVDNGNYIEKYSITDTFDINAPTNSLHTHYGTLCPDGLLPCDGKWRDVMGIDSNAYLFNELPAVGLWGDRWFEETPNYMHRVVRGANIAFTDITAGPFNPLTNAGGADHYTMLGGNIEHSHSFPHGHNPGTYNVLVSGTHPGEHQVSFNGSTEFAEVNTIQGGQKVSVFTHNHNLTITGGDHSHSKDSFSGKSEILSGNDANTLNASSWAPYREAMICIKKV